MQGQPLHQGTFVESVKLTRFLNLLPKSKVLALLHKDPGGDLLATRTIGLLMFLGVAITGIPMLTQAILQYVQMFYDIANLHSFNLTHLESLLKGFSDEI
jgi:hypothetical protein